MFQVRPLLKLRIQMKWYSPNIEVMAVFWAVLAIAKEHCAISFHLLDVFHSIDGLYFVQVHIRHPVWSIYAPDYLLKQFIPLSGKVGFF